MTRRPFGDLQWFVSVLANYQTHENLIFNSSHGSFDTETTHNIFSRSTSSLVISVAGQGNS